MVAVAATLLSLVVAEGVLRATERYATATELAGQGYQSGRDFSRFRIPWVGFDSRASTSFTIRQPEFTYVVRTNSAGVRDDEHPVEKASEELRIAVLGDSFVASHGVDWEHAWTEVLERGLSAELGRPVTVLAGGVPGHDPVFSFHLLRQRLLPYRPDVVVLVVNPSDVHDVMLRGGLDRYTSDGWVRPPPPSRKEWLLARSHLARALLITTSRQPNAALTLTRMTDAQIARACEELTDAAVAIAELGRAEGFETLVLSQPLMNDLTGPGGPGILAPVLPLAVARGVRAVDLQPWFVARLEGRRVADVFFPVDQHFNEEGYALLAEAVKEVLSNAGLLPAPVATGALRPERPAPSPDQPEASPP